MGPPVRARASVLLTVGASALAVLCLVVAIVLSSSGAPQSGAGPSSSPSPPPPPSAPPPSSGPPPSSPAAPPDRGVNRTDEEGQRVWDGAPDPAMEAATLPVQELLWTRTDVFAGAALTSDGTMLEIFVTDDGAEVVDQARDLLGAEFDAYVRVVPVEHSWDELTAAQDAVFAGDGAEGLGIISAGIDIVGNHLDVGIDVEMDGERIAAAHPEGITASTPRTTPLERHLVPIAAEHDVLIDLRAEEMAVAA